MNARLALQASVFIACLILLHNHAGAASEANVRWFITDPELSVLAEAFNASNRQFVVEPILPETNWVAQLYSGMATESFDLIDMNEWQLAQFVEDGAILELETPLRRRGVTRLDTNEVIDQTRYLGKVYGIPLQMNHHVVFAQTELLQEAGLDLGLSYWTWGEFKDWARRAASLSPGMHGIVVGNGIWTIPYAQSGADYVHGPYDRLKSVLQLMEELRHPDVHLPADAYGSWDIVGSFFWTRNTAMTIEYIPKPSIILDPKGFTTIPDGGWTLLPLPTLESASTSSYVSLMHFTGIPANGRATQQSLDFLEWLMGHDAAEIIVSLQNTPRIPVSGWENVLPQLEYAYGPNIRELLLQPMIGLSGSIHPYGHKYYQVLQSAVQHYFAGNLTMDRAIELVIEASSELTVEWESSR